MWFDPRHSGARRHRREVLRRDLAFTSLPLRQVPPYLENIRQFPEIHHPYWISSTMIAILDTTGAASRTF